jgi:gas vesicle protein
MCWLGFLVGMMVGGTIGALAMAMVQVGSEHDRTLK